MAKGGTVMRPGHRQTDGKRVVHLRVRIRLAPLRGAGRHRTIPEVSTALRPPAAMGNCQVSRLVSSLFVFLLKAVFVFFWSRFLFMGGFFLRRSSLLSAREGSRCQLTIQSQ